MVKTDPPRKRKWKPTPEELVKSFDDAIGKLEGVERRKMFGYPCAFVNGNMFFGCFGDKLMMRLSEKDRKISLETGLFKPFEPMPGRRMREYVEVPGSFIKSGEDFESWLGRSHGYAISLPPKTAGGKKRARGKIDKNAS
jgi:hypothetical protein